MVFTKLKHSKSIKVRKLFYDFDTNVISFIEMRPKLQAILRIGFDEDGFIIRKKDNYKSVCFLGADWESPELWAEKEARFNAELDKEC